MSKNNELSILAQKYFDWIDEESDYFWGKIIEMIKMNKRFVSEDYGHQYYTEIVDMEKELDESVDNPSKRLTITECIDLLNDFALTIDKLNEDNAILRKDNEDLEFALRAERALSSVHNSSQPFRI